MSRNAIFFVSSAGDTDLAKETIKELLNNENDAKYYLVPLTNTAKDRIKDLENANSQIVIESITNILGYETFPENIKLSDADALKLNQYIDGGQITMAYVGVCSNNATLPYDIAKYLEISCILANEYMYKDPDHRFWENVNDLSKKENMLFAVPLAEAEKEIHSLSEHAKTAVIGHLCIDNAMTYKSLDAEAALAIREQLHVSKENEYVFISGTSQAIGNDSALVEALLQELSTGQYPNLILRLGIHPGIEEKENYLKDLLQVCEKYQFLSDQFKIILPSNIENKLNSLKGSKNPFLLRLDMSGPVASGIADKITQAAPGALVNQAVLLGLPTYCPLNKSKAYLPSGWSESITEFFKAKPTTRKTRSDLGLEEKSAPKSLAKLFMCK